VLFLLINIMALSLLFLFISSPNISDQPTDDKATKSIQNFLEKSNEPVILPNSVFRVTRRTQSYEVTSSPKCYYEGCNERNNKRAYAQCQKLEATEWNALGVRVMERVVGGPVSEPFNYQRSLLLKDAVEYFNKAIAAENDCIQSHINLGLVLFALDKFDEALKEWDFVLQYQPTNARVLIFQAFLEAYRSNRDRALSLFEQARSADPDIDRQYLGLQFNGAKQIDVRLYGFEEENEALRDMLLYKEFAEVPMSNYALLQPGTQDFFISTKYIILRKVIPPFVLRAMQRCLHSLIKNGRLRLGDTQALRYVAYNDRCSRWVHFQLTDLIRKVVAHNAQPSYTYFGGYVPGSTLQPHTDRYQCEFTLSLTVEHRPPNATWLLSLGKKPLFEYDPEWPGRSAEKMPPEDEIVDTDLYAGDALLFMGRHLVHFRRGALPQGQWTNQVFLHYVPEVFNRGLG
jgi:tetratricopeptide (TPR) repeat protein